MPSPTSMLAVALGGAFGSLMRYLVSLWVAQSAPTQAFPLGTFAINLTGCFLAGLLVGAIERHGVFSPDVRLLLMTGVLGGFTTFSAFGIETLQLLRREEWLVAIGYAGGSVLVGVALALVGFRLAAQ